MKHLLALLIVGSLTVTFVGCGDAASTAPKPAPVNVAPPPTTPAPPATTEGEKKEDAAPAEGEKKEGAAPAETKEEGAPVEKKEETEKQ